VAQPAFKYELHGLKELMDAFDQLPTVAMKKTVVRNALKKSSIPILESAKLNAMSIKADGRSLAESININTRLKRSQRRRRADRTRVTTYVGSSHPLAHLFEFGTTGRHTKKGAYRGFITPMPFMRTAWDANKRTTLKLLSDELWKSLQKAARMLAKKSARGTLTAKQRAGLMR